MGLLLYAAWLAAGLLAAGEMAYIILSCGPFWLRLDDFLLAWLIYFLPALLGVACVAGILRLLPSSSGTQRDPGRRFRAVVLWTGGVGALLLTALVFRDLKRVGMAIGFALTFVGLGLIYYLCLSRKWMRWPPRLIPGLLVAVSPLLIFAILLTASNAATLRSTRRATAAFHGPVPHLCLIVLDTVRSDHLSCYGYEFPTTPNIDRVAAEGLLCRNATSASSWTPPGHISIFTGTYPSQQGNDGWPETPDELLTLTEILRPQGYFTIAMYNNPMAGPLINLTQGFHSVLGIYHNAWVYPAWARLQRKFLQPDVGARTTFRIAARTMDWLVAHKIPAFLYINVLEPHAPYTIHEPYFTRFFGDRDPATIPNLAQVRRLCRSMHQVNGDTTRFAGYTPESYAYLAAAYDSEIAYLDHHLGGFVDHLRGRGILDEILLTITSDHGEFVGERFTRGHPPLMLNPVLRIPLILRYPRLIAPQVLEEQVSNVDVLPTLLGLLEITYPEERAIPGIDIRSEALLKDRLLLSEKLWPNGGCYSLRQGPYKLVLHRNEGMLRRLGEGYLFRVDQDPEELHDLYREEPEVVESMTRILDDLEAAIRVSPGEEQTLSPQARETMRALGYIE